MNVKNYKSRFSLCLLSLLFLFLTGCQYLNKNYQSLGGYPDRVVPIEGTDGELKSLKHYFTDDIMGTYNSKTGVEKQSYRDEIVHSRLRAVDLLFEAFEEEIQLEKNLTEMGIDLAVLGLSGAGAISGGAATKAILAAISGGLTGAELTINKNLYYEKTMPILLVEMEAMRAEQLVKIYTGLKQDTMNYPLSRALFDIDVYYKVGTLPGAIIGINNQAGAKHQDADNNIEQLLLEGSFIKDDAGTVLKKFWKPDGKNINNDNQQKIKQWMETNGIGEESIIFFIRDKARANMRGKAVNDLGLTE